MENDVSDPQPQPLNWPVVVGLSLLLGVAIPALPIYLWRKGRLSMPVGIGLALAWVAMFVTVGILTHQGSATSQAIKPTPAVPRESSSALSPSAGATSGPGASPSGKPAQSDHPAQSAPTSPSSSVSPRPTSTPTPASPTKPGAAQAPSCAGIAAADLKNPALAFECQFGDEWPLSVDHGVLTCRQKSGSINAIVTFVAPDGKEYALNGLAVSTSFPAPTRIIRVPP
jgi:hypothetical protein